MESALIVSTTEKSIAFFTHVLEQVSINKIAVVSTAGEAKRLLVENDYDICVVNTPLPDEFGESLARNVAARGISEVVLVVDAGHYDEVSDKVEDFGVITVSKPINKALFWNALKLAQASHKKMQSMQKENKMLLQKIEDIRIVDRAKCILISYLAMTEPEAHKYIERQAMDMRITKRSVAENILKTYEN